MESMGIEGVKSALDGERLALPERRCDEERGKGRRKVGRGRPKRRFAERRGLSTWIWNIVSLRNLMLQDKGSFPRRRSCSRNLDSTLQKTPNSKLPYPLKWDPSCERAESEGAFGSETRKRTALDWTSCSDESSTEAAVSSTKQSARRRKR